LCRTLSESCESVQEKIINQMNVWDNEGSHTVSRKYLPPLYKAAYVYYILYSAIVSKERDRW
jgi:hypothetical protein